MAKEKQPNPGDDTGKTGGRADNPKVPGDARDRAAGDVHRTDTSEPSAPEAAPAARAANPTGRVIPGETAPSGAPTGPGGQAGDSTAGGPVPSPEKADPGRTVRGTTGAPPSLATGEPQNALGDLPESTGAVGGSLGRPGVGGSPAGGPADDMSVRSFVAVARRTLEAGIAGRWGEMIAGGGELLSVFADVFGGTPFTVSGVMPANDQTTAVMGELDALAELCNRCKERVSDAQTRTRKFRWAGEHDHTTGSPPGMAADVKTFNPALAMLIAEMVAKLIEEFRKRRPQT